MKRSERRASQKTPLEPTNPHTYPDHDGQGNQSRDVTGDVHIRGEVFVEPSPKEALSRYTADKKEDTRYRRKSYLDWATFAVVTIYAFLTGIQSCQSKRAADAATNAAESTEKTLIISQRAYLTFGDPSVDLGTANIAFPLSNNGRLPASDVRVVMHEVTISIQNPKDPDRTSTPEERYWSLKILNNLPVGPAYRIRAC